MGKGRDNEPLDPIEVLGQRFAPEGDERRLDPRTRSKRVARDVMEDLASRSPAARAPRQLRRPCCSARRTTCLPPRAAPSRTTARSAADRSTTRRSAVWRCCRADWPPASRPREQASPDRARAHHRSGARRSRTLRAARVAATRARGRARRRPRESRAWPDRRSERRVPARSRARNRWSSARPGARSPRAGSRRRGSAGRASSWR